jgi:hypothetical protein
MMIAGKQLQNIEEALKKRRAATRPGACPWFG